MATIVAAAGGGAWTQPGSWVGGVAPSAADDAQIPLAAGNMTIDAGAVCRSADFATYTGTLTHTAGVTWTIGDATAGLSSIALRLVAGMTYTLGNVTTSAISFVTTAVPVQTVDFAGLTTGNVTYVAPSSPFGSWQMTGAHNTGATATVTLTRGTLDVNGQTCSWGLFSSSNSNTRSLTLGAAAITLTGVSSTVWDFTTATNLTFSGASSTITVTDTVAPTFNGGAKTFGTLNMPAGSSTSTLNSSGSHATLTITGAASKTAAINFAGATTTVSGTLTINGNSITNRVLVAGATVGTTRTINAATVVVTNADFRDITGAGAGSWNLSAITGGSGDDGGNTGITFTTAAAQTWSGTSGGNWSTNAWTSRVPLPQDDVSVASAFGASQTITVDMPRMGGNISFVGTTGTPALALSSVNTSFRGSFAMVAAMTTSGNSGKTVTARGRAAHTFTSAGVDFRESLTLEAPTGTLTLQDALLLGASSSGTLTVLRGTFNANGFDVTAAAVNSNSNSTTRTLTMGTGAWNLTATGATTVWNFAGTTGLTFSGASATITIVNASASTRTFAGGGLTYGTLTYTVAGSTGTLIISGSNTFTTINFSDANNARTLTLTAGTTTTVTNLNVNGTPGKLMTINSSTPGTPATISKASGTVTGDYLSLQDSAATGGATFLASHSTNVSGNSGWVFLALSGSTMLLMGV